MASNFSQTSWTDLQNAAANVAAYTPIGPGGKDPHVMVPRILNFLRDEDFYRNPGWEYKLAVIDEYLEQADKQRRDGEFGYQDYQICASLEDARIMVQVHKNYAKWNSDLAKIPANNLRGPQKSSRLPAFPKQCLKLVPNPLNYKHKRIELLPRPEGKRTPFPLNNRMDLSSLLDDENRTGILTIQLLQWLQLQADEGSLDTFRVGTIEQILSMSGVDRGTIGRLTDWLVIGGADPKPFGQLVTTIDWSSVISWFLTNASERALFTDSENRFHARYRRATYTPDNTYFTSLSDNTRFDIENSTYESYVNGPMMLTATNAPQWNPKEHFYGSTNQVLESVIQPSDDGGRLFYEKRGWHRAALQQCLNMFSNHENRVINTPWRRVVLPPKRPLPMPKEIVWHPRSINPERVADHVKDPSPWIYWFNNYSQQIDYLSGWQRRRYNVENWKDFQRSSLPMNFRGPYVYRGLSIHDDHWLKIGEYLESLQELMKASLAAAPRPLLAAILRDIDAALKDPEPSEADFPNQKDREIEEALRLRWDVKARTLYDWVPNTEHTPRLVDEIETAWLRYLCEPSRTLDMCRPAKQPTGNLAVLFDNRLQTFLRDLYESGVPEIGGDCWDKNFGRAEYGVFKDTTIRPPTLRRAVGYINGVESADVLINSSSISDPDQPNKLYQFSLNEATHICIELHKLGRIQFVPATADSEAYVMRPRYTLHPEDRVRWRYVDNDDFQTHLEEYRRDMILYWKSVWVGHTKATFEKGWTEADYSRYIEWLLDHVGDRFGQRMLEREKLSKASGDPRVELLSNHLVDERSYVQHDNTDDWETDMETLRGVPRWEDLMTWDQVGFDNALLIEKEQNPTNQHVFIPKTPEKNCQFFRNLATRMGYTMRHIRKIRQRLTYADHAPVTVIENNAKKVEIQPVTRWWQPISVRDFHQNVQHWEQSIEHGVGEVQFIPPRIEEVLDKSDPNKIFQTNFPGKDAFDVVREGILRDCMENRPVLYPGRQAAFSSLNNDPMIGYERPSLFNWATDEQRRYQAPYTRKSFFSMMRWPLHYQHQARQQALRERKDQHPRRNPRVKETGILTWRIPMGTDKAEYGPAPTDTWKEPMELQSLLPGQKKPKILGPDPGHGPLGDLEYGKFPPGWQVPQEAANIASEVIPTGQKATPALTRFTRPTVRFIPGPAVFPAGETLLQQVLISQRLEAALYPEQELSTMPWHKWLQTLWWRYTESSPPAIPLVPPIKGIKIPRSNPNKRKVPADFYIPADHPLKKLHTTDGIGRLGPKDDGTTSNGAPTSENGANWLRGKGQPHKSRPNPWYSTTVPKTPVPMPAVYTQKPPDFTNMTQEAKEAYQAARANFEKHFPKGYNRMPTSANLSECALYALQNSMKAQYPKLRQPTIKELKAAFNSPAMKQQNADAQLSNTNNFTADQTGGILYYWGLTKGYNLQLGVLVGATNTPQILSSQHNTDGLRTVWIHNDQTVYPGHSIAAANQETAVAHFEGLQPK